MIQKKRYTIKKKMILTFIPLTIIALLIISASAFVLYSKSLQNSYERLVNETLKQVNLHLDTYLNDIIHLTESPYYNDSILNVLENDGNLSPIEQNTIMDEELYTILTTLREDIQGVYFYRNDGTTFSKSRYRVTIDSNKDYLNSDWYHHIMKLRKSEFFINELNRDGVNNRPSRAFSVAKGINLFDEPSMAAMVIDINFSGLESLVNTVDIGQKSNILIVDENNNLIMSKNQQYLQAMDEINFHNPSVQQLELDNDSMISAYSTSDISGWKIIAVVSKQEIFSELNTIQRLILIISIVTIILITGACIFVSHRITQPLSHLKRLMKEVKKGNYSIAMTDIRNDEIGDVASTFNDMQSHMDELINQVLEGRYKQKEAELNNLKYQIRPHFLYNTLESIRALAEIKGNLEIVDMSSSLGAFLRYSIKQGHDFVFLKDEFNQVNNYINIQQRRFGNLDIRYNLEPFILNSRTIPLILQPLVENAIQHGLEEKLYDRIITIEGTFRNHDLIIKVIDNGKGMEASLVKQINDALAENNYNHKQLGIGLNNVDSRIKMTYGNQYGLRIESEWHKGTTMIVTIPYMP